MNAYDVSLLSPRPAMPPSPAQLAARLARFKIKFLNRLIERNGITDLIQFGCGDGKLLRRLKIGAATGVDQAAVPAYQPAGDADRRFLASDALPEGTVAELALSMDVIDRLTDAGAFNIALRQLFETARRYVVIHGSDAGPASAPPRRFTTHVARYFPAWRLAARVPSPLPTPGPAGAFFVFARDGAGCVIPVIALA